MKNIFGAARLLWKGKWVRRRGWPGEKAIAYDPEALDGNVCVFRSWEGSMGARGQSFSGRSWEFNMEDLMSLDWEEVPEKTK